MQARITPAWTNWGEVLFTAGQQARRGEGDKAKKIHNINVL